MQVQCLKIFQHPLFQLEQLGSPNWWMQFQQKQPLIFENKQNSKICVFLWRQKNLDECFVYIRFSEKERGIYSQWSQLKHIPATDIFYDVVELENDWSGFYQIISSAEAAPKTDHIQTQRIWWQKQLLLHTQIDPFNANQALTTSTIKWINQL